MFPDKPTPLRRLFNEATQQVSDGKWGRLSSTRYWQDILPCPPIPKLPFIAGFRMPTQSEQQLTWALWATEFLNRSRERIQVNLTEFKQHLGDELAVWNRHHPEKNEQLPVDKTYYRWLSDVETLSLTEFTQLRVSVSMVRQFLKPKCEEIVNRYGLATNDYPPRVSYQDVTEASDSVSGRVKEGSDLGTAKAPEPLTLRQIALLHIYLDKTISRGKEADKIASHYGHKSGEKLYKHYKSYVLTHDRIGVEDGQIKRLISNLNKIIPLLDGPGKHKAEAEKRIISAKF